MPTPVQLGAAAGVVTATVVGGYTIYVVTTSEGETITPDRFESNFNFATSDYNNKLLSLIKKENLPLLVKPAWDKGEQWWKGAFEARFKDKKQTDNLHDYFKNLDKGFDADLKQTSPKALNVACHLAYKAETSEYKFDDNKNLLKSIGAFCTVSDQAIDVSEPAATTYKNEKTISETTHKNGVLSVQANKEVLVKKIGNDLWWKWAYKNLIKDKNKEANTIFKEVNSDIDSSGTNKPLNAACDSAYQKKYKDLKQDKNKLLKEINKYCSIDRGDNKIVHPLEPTPSDFISGVQNTYSSKIIKDPENSKRLVDPAKSNNEDWWEWIYDFSFVKEKEGSLKNKLQAPFLAVSYAYKADADEKALNQACKKAYEKDDAALSAKVDGKETLLNLIKKFCVPTAQQKTDFKIPT